MSRTKNVFLTNDITIKEWESDNPDRYEYTRAKLNPDEYNFEFKSLKEWKKENILTKPENEKTEYQEAKQEAFEEWAENNLNYEELYEMPMMNALRYFPSFIDFEEEDRYKVSGATCLLYNNELEAWAVAMSGGGMDLAPHLLDTFIELEKGVPIELAEAVNLNYNAYVDNKKHIENCKLLAKAFREKAKVFMSNAKQLKV